MPVKGKSAATIKAESDARRQLILNSQAYKSGERFDSVEAARLLGGSKAQAYDLLMKMVEEKQLNLSCKKGARGWFTRRNGDYLKIPWRKHTNFEILNR